MMGRGSLMALLGLDLVVMGISGYVMWDRASKSFSRSTAPAVFAKAPVLPQSHEPPPPAPEPEPDPQTLSKAKNAQTNPALRHDAAHRQEPAIPRKFSFTYRDPGAKEVAIIGDFNRWSPQAMKKDASQRWSAALTLKPGEYAYNFVVDGKMIRDPSQKQSRKRAGQKIPASVITVRSKS